MRAWRRRLSIITARSNQRIKEFRRLEKKSREHIRIEGLRHVRDAMREYPIRMLLVTPEHEQHFNENNEIHVVSESIMNQLSHTKSPSGVLALFERPKMLSELPQRRGGKNRLVLVCT